MAGTPTLGYRVGRRVARYGTLQLARRLGVSAPVIGTVVALVTAGAAMRRKGMLGGTIDTALNAIPLLGAVKNAIEIVRGDFIPDRTVPAAASGGAAPSSTPPASTRRSVASRAKAIRL
jgi:hypothetical protein